MVNISLHDYGTALVSNVSWASNINRDASACWLLASDGRSGKKFDWSRVLSDSAALIAYDIHPEGYSNLFGYDRNRVSVTESTDMGFRALLNLLIHEKRTDAAYALLQCLAEQDKKHEVGFVGAKQHVELTGRRLPCPYVVDDSWYGATDLPKPMRLWNGIDLGAPHHTAPGAISRELETVTTERAGYYLLGWANYLGHEVVPPPSSKVVAGNVSWWKSAFFVRNFGDRANYKQHFTKSYECLYLALPGATREEKVKGLRAFTKLAADSQREVGRFIFPIEPEVITAVRSKDLPEALFDLPWAVVGDALGNDAVQAHLLAFLVPKLNYRLLFSDHPERKIQLRAPTREELVAMEDEWVAEARRLLAAGEAARMIRARLHELGGTEFGAFALLRSVFDPEVEKAIGEELAAEVRGIARIARDCGLLVYEMEGSEGYRYLQFPEMMSPSAAFRGEIPAFAA